MEENPFPDLKITSSDFLDVLSGRSKCTKCQKSRKYYCYNCCVPVPEIEGKVPKVKLPLKVDIIKHPSEVDGKSTAVHAAVIAPDDVTVYTYPCVPDYDDPSKVVLVFPGEASITLADLAKKLEINTGNDRQYHKRKACDCKDDGVVCCAAVKVPRLKNEESNVSDGDMCSLHKTSFTNENLDTSGKNKEESTKTNSLEKSPKDDLCAKDKPDLLHKTSDDFDSVGQQSALVPSCGIERVVFIDSTWNQTKTICCDERLKGLQCLELKQQETKFWRHQKDIPNTYLSTIEAIYYFLREYHEHFIENKYNGEYDNLLFFFTYMYRKIRTLYDGGNDLKAYKKRLEK